MGKKNINNPGDDMFNQLGDMGDGAGDMAHLQSYEKFDVEDKIKKLEEKSKQLIIAIANTYLQAEKITNDDYIKAVSEAEQSNLVVLMKQVKYSEHVLDSLMRQLDAGGYVDNTIFETIRVMQKSAIEITLEVSRYVRTLPEYFKFLGKEINNAENTLRTLEQASEQKQLAAISATSSETDKETFSMAQPMRGTREMMLHMTGSLEDLDKAIENSEKIDATPVSVDDDDDEDADYEEVDDDLEDDYLDQEEEDEED